MSSPPPSYVCGASVEPLIYVTLGHAFDDACARWGEREALVACHQNRRFTYAELGKQVAAFAAGLIELGIKRGERIGIWSPNNAEWVIAQLATAKAGLVLVNINPAYRLAELEYALNKVECSALITAHRFKNSDYLDMLRTLAPELATAEAGWLRAARLPHLRTVIAIDESNHPGMYRFIDIARHAEPNSHAELARIGAELQPDDPVNIQFTSGNRAARIVLRRFDDRIAGSSV